MEKKSYISTHTLGHTGPVTGSLYLFTVIYQAEMLSLHGQRYVMENSSVIRIQQSSSCVPVLYLMMKTHPKSKMLKTVMDVSAKSL
jgi:hypothetical protein